MKRFRARYTINGTGLKLVKDWDAASPITALNNVHKFIQIESGIKHNEYTIDSLDHIYSSDPHGRAGFEEVESTFDLPKTSNPDLTPRPQHPTRDTITMPFLDECHSTRPA